MKLKHKKITAFALAIMIGGLLAAAPSIGAEERSGNLDVKKFASKNQLLSSFDADSSTSNKLDKKVYFGKDESGEARQWQITGKDAVGEGLVLLSDSTFGEQIGFKETFDSEQFYQNAWNCAYESAPEKVYSNHYGGSDLRSALKAMEKNEKYFSEQEQRVMADTVITTYDQMNRVSYTTTDKLYAPYGIKESKSVTVGTNSQDELQSSIKIDWAHWPTGFWLRSGDNYYKESALYAQKGLSEFSSKVVDHRCYISIDVVPALQLKGSSLLFGTSAKEVVSEGSVDLDENDVFTLRYDAGDSLGAVEVMVPGKNIVDVSGAPEGTYLVVQNDEGVWAKNVSGNTQIKASDMNADLTSYENCEVWLEKSDGSIIKASMAGEKFQYAISVAGGEGMIKTSESGDEQQVVKEGMNLEDVIYVADSGYYFPEDYVSVGQNGITVRRDSYTQITVSGIPTGDTDIMLEAAAKKLDQEAPDVEGHDGKLTGTTSEMEYSSSPDGPNWTTCTDGTTDVENGTWYVRYKGTETKNAGAAVKVEVKGHLYEDGNCTVCGAAEKKGGNAETGDTGNMFFWAVLLLAAGTTGTVVYNRRKNA